MLEREAVMVERRSVPRFSVSRVVVHQCIVTLLGRETWLEAQAGDLSANGVCLYLKDSLNSGENLYLLMTVHREGKEPRDLEVNGVTAHCRPLDDGRWRVGIQFYDLLGDDKASWEAYLA